MLKVLTRIKNFFSKEKFGLLKPQNIIKYFWLKIKGFRYTSWRDHLFFFILYYIFLMLILKYGPITPEFLDSICLDKKYYGWSDFHKPKTPKIELKPEKFTITKEKLQIAGVIAVITIGVVWLIWRFQG